MSSDRNRVFAESMNGDYFDNGDTSLASLNRAEGFERMKALAEGGILLRAGRFIRLEDRTNQKRQIL